MHHQTAKVSRPSALESQEYHCEFQVLIHSAVVIILHKQEILHKKKQKDSEPSVWYEEWEEKPSTKYSYVKL